VALNITAWSSGKKYVVKFEKNKLIKTTVDLFQEDQHIEMTAATFTSKWFNSYLTQINFAKG
jgi:NAD-dependent DNA ligase